jgi:iron-sulfur cluster repair protein YtfE (RIC family)
MPNASLHTSDMLIASADPLNVIVARYPRALAVFQRFGLDACCGGSLPLHTALARRQGTISESLR